MVNFIMVCQDEDGGFADRPGDEPDPYHTLFGLAGLSLFRHKKYCLNEIDAVFCMTKRSLRSLSYT
ncbi:hypothetical protein AB6A40_010165 [Gnathostoma spinigerum]|uniref:Geranylgeranyl transferase type II subunit beta n=1 Tax=Gnathostoma spinigerum TaxID=75299 RepID=A0ABD6F0L7_9BILA